ncbi:uncharacterized protein Eint_101170 [Encephalitozoon intestinalis ATCC 50506]|uniref:Uncharacterized protein n=1 Tax=Encephalitozoon intestinalis (strain ATCC 50506) TaxID=876142 RepID=E0S9Q7_ENCIT|nr:uncharacterized protein Eint_101170 [Encephalitozoon intestinalis ATCC 50506]ADM12442.1 hypothetical protein Eint_101170 [Encephalitozoon intestinalis ATCC 50506]UTX46278.1 hypothetical protein GPK93_10g18780 [Encephalitozoon intestinalis]
MCSEIKVLERNNETQIDTLLYDHTLVHITFNTKEHPLSPRDLSINHLGRSSSGSVKVFVNSKKVDFSYELVFGYALSCIGIEEYDCKVYLFDDTDDLCVLKNLMFAIDEKFKAGLRVFSDHSKTTVSLGGKIIYETTIVL